MTEYFVGEARPLTITVLRQAANLIGCSRESLFAVISVECGKVGFLQDKRPAILFERHIFSQLTHGRFDEGNKDISAPLAGEYGAKGAHQYKRLAKAIGFDRNAALRSTSWGMGQIMGHNHKDAGYPDVQAMITAFMHGENEQILAMARLIAMSTKMRGALIHQRWEEFARLYNGPAYRRNRYDERLATARADLSRTGLPNIPVRAMQIQCWYASLLKEAQIDGVMGPITREAWDTLQAAGKDGGATS